MLTQAQVAELAQDLAVEARRRSYVEQILAPDFVDDVRSWEMLLELLEVVLHRRGHYIVPETVLAKLGTTPAALQATLLEETT